MSQTIRVVQTDKFRQWLDSLDASRRDAMSRKLASRFVHVRPEDLKQPHIFGHAVHALHGAKDIFIYFPERDSKFIVVFGVHRDEAVLLGSVPFDQSHGAHTLNARQSTALAQLVEDFRAYTEQHPAPVDGGHLGKFSRKHGGKGGGHHR